MKRQRKARVEQEQKIAEKELKRKLRRPKFDKGSDENIPYEFTSDMYTKPLDTKGILAEQVVTPQGNYTLLNPKGGDAWSIGALEDMRVPLYRSTAIPRQKDVVLQHLEDKAKADEFANRTSLTPERFLGLMAANVPLATGALGTVAAAPAAGNAIMEGVVNPVSDYIGSTAAGQFITKALTNPYVDTGLKSAFAGHGLNHWINEGVDGWGDAAMTALEMAPLGGLARPMWNAAKTAPKFPTAMEGVKYAYNRNPELANIGTLEDYIDYLKTVFPESKVRTLNYHMGPKGLQELKPSTGEVWNTNPNARGIYVSPETPYIQAIRKFTTARLEKPSAWTYMKRNLTPGGWNKANEIYTDIYPVMIDTRAPLHTKGGWTWGIKDEKYKSLMNEYDAIVSSGPKWYENFNRMPETILPKTEQTLILGSDADAAGFRRFMSNPQITANSVKRTKGSILDTDLLQKLMYSNKIHGKPMYPSDEGGVGFSKSVRTGIPKKEYDELLHDVIGRNVREFERAGLNDAQTSDYVSNAKRAMDNVNIGRYSNSDYVKADMRGIGGFYDSEGNFISVNTDGPFTKTKVVKHEGRHLLDHKVDDEILMPTLEESFGKDFDSDAALSTMQKVKQNQNMILYDAYDNDFVTLPSKEGYNGRLEGYSSMGREAVTTNLDARNELLGSKADWPLDVTDKIIDKASDDAIFEAVAMSNGYGQRYIKFLMDNNKLTPKKA